MEDWEPLPFPTPLERALVAIRRAAKRDLVAIVHRRRHRRELDALGFRRENVVDCLLSLTAKDFRHGPHPDHHDAARDVWIFGPWIEGHQMYVKVAIGQLAPDEPTRIFVWSFHRARHPMPPPSGATNAS
jgi:Motility quorum-sensing regulator, toxin of MqsA